MVGQTVPGTGRRSRPRCRALDGLIADGREVWLLVAREPAELTALLSGSEGFTLCRPSCPTGRCFWDAPRRIAIRCCPTFWGSPERARP
jgi:hypothetical protein